MAGVAAAITVGVIGAATIGTSIYAAEKGASEASKSRRSAEQLRQEALENFDKIKLPDLQARRLELERYKSVGDLSPELEAAIAQEESLLNQIEADPRFVNAQLKALQSLEDIADEGGLTIEDRAKLEQIKADINNRAKGARRAITQKAAERGTLTGGLQYAEQLQSEQGYADRASMEAFQVGADARKRALEAIEKGGIYAGQLRTQEFGEEAEKAAADDAINRFNVGQQQSVQQRNVAIKNLSAQRNLENLQRIADVNVQTGQQETIYNIEKPNEVAQQQFINDLAIAQGKAGQIAPMAGAADKSAADSAAKWGGVASGIGKIGGGLLDYTLKNYGSASGGTTPTSGEYVASADAAVYDPDKYKLDF